jgi:hypothetical protein
MAWKIFSTPWKLFFGIFHAMEKDIHGMEKGIQPGLARGGAKAAGWSP